MSRAAHLYQLQQLDDEEGKLRGRLAQIEASLVEPPALQQARQAVQRAAEALRQAAVRQQDLELQVAGLKQKHDSSEQRLYGGTVRNPKELSDLQAEVASLKRRLKSTEDDLLEAMIAREEATEVAAQAQEHLEKTEREWNAAQHSLLEEKDQLQTRLAELAAARDSLLPMIPADDLKTYRRLRAEKKGSAVARVHGEACGECWMEIPPGRLQQARQDDLVFCGNCERILFLED